MTTAERRQVKYVKDDISAYGQDLVALDRTLYKFYGEVHTVEGLQFTPSSLQVLRAGLQRHLSDVHEGMPNMATHPAFRRSDEQFKAAKRRFALESNRAEGTTKMPMDPEDQEVVRQYDASRKTYEDPTVLQQYIYYMLSMTFGYRGREIWHQLKKDSFVERRDALGRAEISMDQSLMKKKLSTHGSKLHLPTSHVSNRRPGGRSLSLYYAETLRVKAGQASTSVPAEVKDITSNATGTRQCLLVREHAEREKLHRQYDADNQCVSGHFKKVHKLLHPAHIGNQHASAWVSNRSDPGAASSQVL